MKVRKLSTIALIALIMISLATVLASTEITVSTDKAVYASDELVTISGVAQVEAWISIEVQNPFATSIFMDIVTATAGVYSTAFRLPLDAMTGTYTVYVSITDATDSTTFTVEETGNLSISTTPTGGEVFVNGTSWGDAPVFEEVAVGTYNVSFGDMDGYVTPEPIIATVVADTTEEILGIYTVEQPELPAETSNQESKDSTGAPKTSFVLGETVLASAEVSNTGTQSQPMLIIVQWKDPDLRALAPTFILVELDQGDDFTYAPGLILPTTGYTTGTWTANIMVLTTWPAQGGVPIGVPVTITITVS